MKLQINAEQIDDAIAAAQTFVAELAEFVGECKRREVDPSDVLELVEAGVDVTRAIALVVGLRDLKHLHVSRRVALTRRVLVARQLASETAPAAKPSKKAAPPAAET